METIQQTARAVTSKPVQRAVVNTVLLVTSAVTLLGVAAIASALFFQSFVPEQVITAPIHLQYGSGLNPYGVVALTSPAMKAQQEYDVSVTLSMPRSPPNVERGNFMIGVYFLDTVLDRSLEDDIANYASTHETFGVTRTVLAQARRQTILPYVDPVVSLASRIMFLFWHLVFPETSQTTSLTVPLAEKISFLRQTGAAKSAFVEVEGGQTIQIYSATLTMAAQLSGLRYLMFHYRLIMYIFFTSLFWIFEVIFMGGAFLIFRSSGETASSQAKKLEYDGGGTKRIEGDDQAELSDRPLTFPTYGKQPALKHEPDIKFEEDESESLMSELPIAGAEADDEDDEDVDYRDSGIGTSYSEEGSSSVRKRSSRNLRE